ncbi:MAG TPA: GNAT family N-acetyltransferase [Dehalococcoidia bacterium]|nr:GNAT family N-acetyltransferase [Dehalococcoidia bacterium]
MDALIAAALSTNQDNLALGNELFAAEGARFIRNAAAPDVRDANLIDSITAASPAQIEALLARAARAYVHCRHLRCDVDPRTPPQFEARLRLDPAWSWSEVLLLVLDGELGAKPPPFDVRRIDGEAGWQAFAALHALNWQEHAERGDEAGAAIAAIMRGKAPPRRFWLGCIDGMPRGYLSSWEGTNGVGQVESLFVQREFRHRGLATALLARGLRDCREHGAGPIVITTDASDTPKQLYAALGWRPLALKRSYLKPLPKRSAAGARAPAESGQAGGEKV